MNVKERKEQGKSMIEPKTEDGYSIEALRKMIDEARSSGYSKETADDTNTRARRRHNLPPFDKG